METEESKFIPESEQPTEDSADITQAKERKAHLIRRYVENHVIALGSGDQTEDLSDEFAELPTAQKANLLYDKLMSRFQALKEMREDKSHDPGAQTEPIDPYLISEIKTLWGDEATAELFCSRYGDARIETQLYKLSELGTRYREINETISQKEKEFEDISQSLFLRRVSRPDQLSATRGKSERLAKELIRLRNERQKITELDGLPPIPENTAIAAHIAYERLNDYHKQSQEGFVWLDSRIDIHHQTMAALQNGRWPVLVGEAGSGKSEQADAAATALTGEAPTHLACSERTSERDMISDKEIDPDSGGSFDAYGPVMQAATGYEDSRQTHPASGGRIVRFDESGRLGSQGYAIIKELRQKKPGDMLFGKPVLPGFGSIWTTNPVGPRYPDRNEPDPAMRRELAYIDVDYPPQTDQNPELYEFMLANLIDENGHIAVSKNELAPAFAKMVFVPPQTVGQYIEQNFPGQFVKEELESLNSADPRLISGQDELVGDPTDPKHGTLWRLAFAIRELQNAFDSGNDQSAPDNALKFIFTPEGKIEISDHGEPLTLATSTITLGEASSWMKGFLDRRLKDNPEFQTDNLTDWIRFKLENYLKQADEQDAGKIRAIFEYFHLFEPAGKTENGEPLTPREIGYLSPRVPRPLHLKHPQPESEEAEAGESEPETSPEAELYSATELTLEDGSKVLISKENISFISKDNQTIQLYPGSVFNLSADRVRFKGVVDSTDPRPEYHGKPVIETDIASGGGLHRIVELSEIAENGEDFWSLEKLTTEEIEKQLGEWKTVYEKLDLTGFTLPTREELMAYLSDNPEFIELLKTKEQQGFTKMVIAPLELKPIIDKLDAQVKGRGGAERYLSDVWKAMLANESEIRYSATISTDANGKDVAVGGETMDQMKASPWEHGILNDCLVSFVKERQNLLKSGDTDETDSTGRKEIKGGLTPRAYLETYFSDTDQHYHGEEAMLPQEWLALFADDLYQKYVKDNKQMPAGASVTDLLDTQTATWFTSTHLPGREVLPCARWYSGARALNFGDGRPSAAYDGLAPRPSVRKSLEL
jgi:hypothetical protein